jgi:hypothetical protein
LPRCIARSYRLRGRFLGEVDEHRSERGWLFGGMSVYLSWLLRSFFSSLRALKFQSGFSPRTPLFKFTALGWHAFNIVKDDWTTWSHVGLMKLIGDSEFSISLRRLIYSIKLRDPSFAVQSEPQFRVWPQPVRLSWARFLVTTRSFLHHFGFTLKLESVFSHESAWKVRCSQSQEWDPTAPKWN